MKSFKDYLKYRGGLSIYEMAAPPVKYTTGTGETETVEEVRKAPIFLDQDDIDYLNQFPPQFWKQALLIRYGRLLYEAHKEKEKGTKVNDRQNVQVAKGVTFNVDTKINKLYNKLTHDVDDFEYSKLKNTDQGRQSYIDHLEKQRLKGVNLGTYGFVLTGYKRDKVNGKEIGVALGYMEPEVSTIDKRLKSWYKALKDGWYEKEMPEDHKISRVDFSGHGGGRKSRGQKTVGMTLPVYSEEKKWDSLEGKTYTSHLPVLRPAIMVRTSSVNKHNLFIRAARQVFDDVHQNNFSEYLKLIDVNSDNLLNQTEADNVVQRLEEVKDWLKKYAGKNKGHTAEMDAKYEERIKLEKLTKAIEFISRPKNSNILRQKLRTASSKQEQEQVIKGFLERLYHYFNNVASNIRSTTKRFDIHSWNISHFSPFERNAHTNWTGFGTINPDWQQPEQVHTAFQRIFGEGDENKTNERINEFWKHLFEQKRIVDDVANGVRSKIEKIRPRDMIVEAIKEALIENIDDISHNACVYFRNKGAQDATIPYATFYKKKFIDNVQLTKEEESKMQVYFKRVRKNSYDQGSNYCQIILQLHTRLKHPERWNRLIRQANPGSGRTPSVSLESIFRSFYELHTGAWAISSHRIDTLRGIMPNADPLRGIVDKTKERIAPSTITPPEQQQRAPMEIPPEFSTAETLARSLSEDSVGGSGPAERREKDLFTKICTSIGRKILGTLKKTTSGLLGRWRGKKQQS